LNGRRRAEQLPVRKISERATNYDFQVEGGAASHVPFLLRLLKWLRRASSQVQKQHMRNIDRPRSLRCFALDTSWPTPLDRRFIRVASCGHALAALHRSSEAASPTTVRGRLRRIARGTSKASSTRHKPLGKNGLLAELWRDSHMVTLLNLAYISRRKTAVERWPRSHARHP
jgi:hypothetical protein